MGDMACRETPLYLLFIFKKEINMNNNIINSTIITRKNINQSGVYLIINLQNNKFYVGSASNFYGRKNKHRQQLRNNKHDNRHLQNAWNKYGEENFIFCILEICEKDRKFLTQREQYWIDTLDATNREIAYNILSFANSTLGLKHPEESREKHRQAALNHSKETRQKINESKYKPIVQLDKDGNYITTYPSKKSAVEALNIKSGDHISDCCSNKRFLCGGFMWAYEEDYIKPNFDVTEKIKLFNFVSNKKVQQYDLNGNLINTYFSAKLAAKELGYVYTNFTKICKYERQYKGYIWKYENAS
jgi:hypothetical protein